MYKQIFLKITTTLLVIPYSFLCTYLLSHLTLSVNALPATDQTFFTVQSNHGDSNVNLLNERIFTGPDVIPTLTGMFSQVAEFANDVAASTAAAGGGSSKGLGFDVSATKPHVHLARREVFEKLCDYLGLCVDFGMEVMVEVDNDDEETETEAEDQKLEESQQDDESSRRLIVDRPEEVNGQEGSQTVMGLESVHNGEDANESVDASTKSSSTTTFVLDTDGAQNSDSTEMIQSEIVEHLLEARRLFNRDMGMPQYIRYMTAREHATNNNIPELGQVILEMQKYARERLNRNEKKFKKRDVPFVKESVDIKQQRSSTNPISVESASEKTAEAKYVSDGQKNDGLDKKWIYNQIRRTNMNVLNKAKERYTKSTRQAWKQPQPQQSTGPISKLSNDRGRIKKQGAKKKTKGYISTRSPQDL